VQVRLRCMGVGLNGRHFVFLGRVQLSESAEA
jgi:hypothetical protein